MNPPSPTGISVVDFNDHKIKIAENSFKIEHLDDSLAEINAELKCVCDKLDLIHKDIIMLNNRVTNLENAVKSNADTVNKALIGAMTLLGTIITAAVGIIVKLL